MAVYLDHAATTPMRMSALEAYASTAARVGNPSSIHGIGQAAKQRLEEARETVAASLGCDPIEVIFTSGGTEAINLAIKGIFWARNPRTSFGDLPRPRLLVPGGEHHATIDTVEWLEQSQGAVIEWIDLDSSGRIDMAALEAAVAREPESVALITALWANNEVGTIQPIGELAALAARHGVPLHLDAVAAFGHVPIDFADVRRETRSAAAGLVALSVSAHKVGGPVGTGALVVSRQASVTPLIHGGGQQRSVRSGTQDVPAAAAFAAAAAEAAADLGGEDRLRRLRDLLVREVTARIPDVVINGPDPFAEPGDRLSMNAHFSFPDCEGDSLLFLLDAAGVAVSTGSACQAGIPEPSHVLRAMGRDAVHARGALRVTLGHTTSEDDIRALIEALPRAYDQARRAGFADRATTIDSTGAHV